MLLNSGIASKSSMIRGHRSTLGLDADSVVHGGLNSRLEPAATSVPATTFHLKDGGRIAPGLRADLLLVRANPT
jgi:alpha-D-ribose 1-methylphosphonate 5-triphosphate diphosphatase PhnM